jgi:plastocyanin
LLPGIGLADNAIVNIADDEYRPADVTVEVGDNVTWRWIGASPHSVYSPDGGFASHPDCNTVNRVACGSAGSTFTHTFTNVGTFSYGCQVHPLRMSGTVTVVPAKPEPSPSPSPEPKPKPSPEPSPEPTPEPTATQPSPAPILRGPPPPLETEPLPVVEGEVETPTLEPSEPPDIDFEPFVEEPDLPTPTALDVVVEGSGPSTAARVLVTGLAVSLLGGWTLFFGREVLFGEPWDAWWQGVPTD